MKTRNMKMMAALLMMLLSITAVQAQRGQGWRAQQNDQEQFVPGQGRMMAMLDLTDEQQTALTTMRTEHMKQCQPLRNEMNEMRARMHTLQTADKADMKVINQQIELMSDKRTELMKLRATHRQQVRAMLTDDQRVIFDAHKRGMNRGDGDRGFGRRGHGQRGHCTGGGCTGYGQRW